MFEERCLFVLKWSSLEISIASNTPPVRSNSSQVNVTDNEHTQHWNWDHHSCHVVASCECIRKWFWKGYVCIRINQLAHLCVGSSVIRQLRRLITMINTWKDYAFEFEYYVCVVQKHACLRLIARKSPRKQSLQLLPHCGCVTQPPIHIDSISHAPHGEEKNDKAIHIKGS